MIGRKRQSRVRVTRRCVIDALEARLLLASTVYEAENATLSGPVVATDHPGYTGTGFADYINANNDFVEWNVTAPATNANYTLVFRHSNGSAANRPLALRINGVLINGALAFNPTGNFDTWANVTLNNITLNAGANTVRLTATGSSGPNIDNLTVTDNIPITPPAAPSALTAQAVSASQVNLTWVRNSTDETGFRLERKTGAGGTYAQIAQLAAGVLSYSDIGLSSNITYFYRVRAFNTGGNSATYSNESSATTLPANTNPAITATNPAPTATGVFRDDFITAEVFLPSGGINPTTLTSTSVKLFRTSDNVAVPAVLNTSGGGDVIVLHPDALLAPNTTYTFQVTAALKDVGDNGFVPFSMTFTTGASTNPSANSSVNFQKTQQTNAPSNAYTCVTFGPDGKLYASARTGQIYRFAVAADGTLGVPELINTVRASNGNVDRLVAGLRFDPASTAGNLILWVTHTFYSFNNAPDWEGTVSRLSGPNLATYQDYVTHLPRSVRDHITNQMDFGPDGALYVMQASNTAMGTPDSAWGFRTEHLLNAAVLRVDTAAIANRISLGQGPLNVQTEGVPTPYDPFAPGAPLTIYASGTRNGYDLIWASNGHLYVPTNGSASGGSVPATPAPGGGTAADGGYVPRTDFATNGSYKPPTTPVATQSNLSYTEPDWLFDIHQDCYYGHPNATRNEYILNGGNPTAVADPFDVFTYPVGTQPDRNYRPADTFELGTHLSADGVIQYQSSTFGGALAGKLLMVSYSGGKNIIAATLNSAGQVLSTQSGFTGTTGFTGPVDLTEDTRNGDIYIADYDGMAIYLLRPVQSNIGANKSRLVFSDPQGGGTSSAQSITLSNTGTGALVIPTSGLTFTGPDAGQFQLLSPPSLPLTIQPGNSAPIQVVFNPTSLGAKGEFLNIASNDPDTPSLSIKLRGLGTAGSQGNNEPPLRNILDTYEIPTNVGFTTLTTPYTPSPIGEEVILPLLGKAGPGPVTIELLATFGPDATPDYALGFYRNGSSATPTPLFTADSSSVAPDDPAQTLNPFIVSGSTSFDPGFTAFGLYAAFSSFSPTRFVYTQDALNTWDGGLRKIRFWPLKNANGAIVPDAYIVGFEEATNNDLQDVVAIIRNVRPPDTTPPTVPTADFLYQTSPHALAFGFSEDVTGLTPNDVTVFKAPSGPSLHPVSVSYNAATHVATYTFASVLPDGRYQATFAPGAITDLAGNGLDGDANGTAGGNRTLSFFYLSGDFNHDAIVNRADFMILYNHFGQSNRLFTDGDMNADGTVDFLDFQRFELQFGRDLPFLPAPPLASAAKPAAPKPVSKPVSPPKPVFAQRPITIARR